jgi:hypothetical protein
VSALLADKHSGHAETADGMNGLVRIALTTLSARVHAKNIVSEWRAQLAVLGLTGFAQVARRRDADIRGHPRRHPQ